MLFAHHTRPPPPAIFAAWFVCFLRYLFTPAHYPPFGLTSGELAHPPCAMPAVSAFGTASWCLEASQMHHQYIDVAFRSVGSRFGLLSLDLATVVATLPLLNKPAVISRVRDYEVAPSPLFHRCTGGLALLMSGSLSTFCFTMQPRT